MHNSSVERAPLNVKKANISCNSVHVGWESPKQISKELSISHYKIKYHPSAEPQEPHYKETDGGICMYTLDGLTPNTSYNIFVCAVFNKGFAESAFSHGVCIETAKEPPVPGVPTVTSKSYNEVYLEWTHSVWACECIQHYVLKYRETTGDWVERDTDDDKTCFKLSGLKPNTSYIFSVYADYGKRTSKISASSEKCTTYAATAPAGVKSEMSFADIMQIKWNSPSIVGNGYFVSKYRVRYYPATDSSDKAQAEETEGATCIHTLRNLKPNTLYKIFLTALFNNGGESAPSDFLEIRTAVANPPAPSKPGIHSITHNSVCLKWDAPGGEEYTITNYSVAYRKKAPIPSNWRVIKCVVKGTNAKVRGLSANTTYEFAVVAD